MPYKFETPRLQKLEKIHAKEISDCKVCIQKHHKLHTMIQTIKIPNDIIIDSFDFYDWMLSHNRYAEEIKEEFNQLIESVKQISCDSPDIIDWQWIIHAFKTLQLTDWNIIHREICVQIKLMINNDDDNSNTQFLQSLLEIISHEKNSYCLYSCLLNQHNKILQIMTSIQVINCWFRVIRLFICTKFNFDKCVKLTK